MKFTNIPANSIVAACAVLGPYVPELSPTSLVKALREHEVNPRALRPKMLNKHQASELLGISWYTLVSHAKTGRIPAVRVGSQWRFDEAEMVAHLSNSRQEG